MRMGYAKAHTINVGLGSSFDFGEEGMIDL